MAPDDPPRGEDNDEETTRVECRACGGHWKIRGTGRVICHWCTEGTMNAKQIATWEARKSGPRRIT
jgi:hypothetical protein